jgi:hypothetical protein
LHLDGQLVDHAVNALHLLGQVLGPILWWTSLREEKRLAAGRSYEPSTIIGRRNWVQPKKLLDRSPAVPAFHWASSGD